MCSDVTGLGKLGESIEKGTKEIRQLAYDFLAPSVKEAGQLIADKVRFTRFSSAIKTFERARELLSDAGLKPMSVDLKTIVPLIEYCSLEEEPEMIERWAGLLATASSGSVSVISYVHILVELGPMSARALSEINSKSEMVMEIGSYQYYGVLTHKVRDALGIDQQPFLSITGDLVRLGLIQRVYKEAAMTWGNVPLGTQENDLAGLTPLGAQFLQSCLGPGNGKKVNGPTEVDC